MRKEFVPFSPPCISEAEIAEVVDTLRSDWITTGPKVKRFEEKFAAARDGAIEFGTIADHVPVPARHEILVPDSAGLDFGEPPEQAALRA